MPSKCCGGYVDFSEISKLILFIFPGLRAVNGPVYLFFQVPSQAGWGLGLGDWWIPMSGTRLFFLRNFVEVLCNIIPGTIG